METTGGFSNQGGETARGKSEGAGATPAAVAGTVFKVPLGPDNQGTFKRVPRTFYSRYEEKEKSRNPPVGVYRPKHEYMAPRVKGTVPYDQYSHVGAEQAARIKNGQFEEYSKLCMCILKALDQEQVDLNHNTKLKSQIYM